MLDSNRWRDVERIYHAAVACEGHQRAELVRRACAGDEALREEVDALLEYDSQEHPFLSAPAIELLDSCLSLPPCIAAGRRIGPYEIVSLLGSGGMGDVYRARDTKLARDVAIKILPDVFADDADRAARFEREARLLAALNHPHIAAIYGLEDREGLHGLVLELVEGQTLAATLRDGPLPREQAFAIGRQVADALHAAHAKGIVHRDLKPANIAITPDGVVKLLDLGLAKYVDREVPGELPSADAPPSANDVSATDGIAGTAAYMSPEQVRRATVDERTDVWAFGCVMWAMLTGCAPFAANTVSETIAAILHRDPDWHGLPSDVPIGVVQLLRRCLERDPQHRLRDIADARTEIGRALGAASPARTSHRPGGRWRTMTVAGGLAAIAAAAGIALFPRVTGRENVPGRVTVAQITNFVDSAVAPAIAPDGRTVAFIRGEAPFLSTDDIYVKALPNGEAVQLTQDSRRKYGLAFSPDGTELAYTVLSGGGSGGLWSTYAVPVTGGEPRLVLANAAGLTWLDRDRVLFSEVETGLHMGIVSAAVDRSDRRALYFPAHERSMAHYSFPSPDRRHALVVEMDDRPVWKRCRLIPLDGSSAGRFVGPDGQCSSAGWSADGEWMYFTAEIDRASHLWRQRYPDGPPEQITFGLLQADGVAVAPDGSIITSMGMDQSTVWLHDRTGRRQVAAEGDVFATLGFYTNSSFSGDGAYLYYLRRESRASPLELWRTHVATGQGQRLLPGVSMVEFDVSREGRHVVFTTQLKGRPSQIWIASLDGRSPPRRIASAGENSPWFGPGGDVMFRFSDGTANYLGRMKPDGSDKLKIVPFPIATVQARSPDGRWVIAITPRLDGGRGGVSLAIPTSGGEPKVVCPFACHSVWSPDGASLYVEVQQRTRTEPGKMVMLPVAADRGLPALPASGIQSEAQALAIPGSALVQPSRTVPGLDRETYADVQRVVRRNLYRIPPP